MSNDLTEPEAWREIARRIAEDQWDGFGLCHEDSMLRWEGRISASTQVAMRTRTKSYLDKETWAYPNGAEPEARILAALWLALEAEEETP